MKQVKYIVKCLLYLWLMLVPTGLWAQDSKEGNAPRVESSADSKKISVAVYENTLYVSGLTEKTIVEVKNMLGENVLVEVVKFPQQKIELNLKRGFYIVRVEDVLQRIVIK